MAIRIRVFVDERKIPYLAVMIPVRELLRLLRQELGLNISSLGDILEGVLSNIAEKFKTGFTREEDDDERR